MFDTIPIRIHTGIKNLEALIGLLYEKEVFWCGNPTSIREIMNGAEGYKHSFCDMLAVTLYREDDQLKYIFDNVNGEEAAIFIENSDSIPTVGYEEYINSKTVKLDDFDQFF